MVQASEIQQDLLSDADNVSKEPASSMSLTDDQSISEHVQQICERDVSSDEIRTSLKLQEVMQSKTGVW